DLRGRRRAVAAVHRRGLQRQASSLGTRLFEVQLAQQATKSDEPTGPAQGFTPPFNLEARAFRDEPFAGGDSPRLDMPLTGTDRSTTVLAICSGIDPSARPMRAVASRWCARTCSWLWVVFVKA